MVGYFLAGRVIGAMFGAIVRAQRRRLNLSQEDLAARAGMSVRNIGRIEGGRIGRPRPATVRLLADAFGLSGDERELFYRSVDGDAPAWPGLGPRSSIGCGCPPSAQVGQIPIRLSQYLYR